ncbi:hypothetical protein ACFLV7_07815 [Chloroflexota bacterium]
MSKLKIRGLGNLPVSLDVENGAPQSPVTSIKRLVRLLHKQIGDGMKLHRRVNKTHMTTPHHQKRPGA